MNKVLVIEDNEDNLRLIAYALRRAGYEIASAPSGEEGVEMATREAHAFILMDINLPGIDGLEATRRIRDAEAGRSVPIIAITSLAMVGDHERVLDAGCTGCIEKPIDPLRIVDQIHAIIGLDGRIRENTDR